MTAQPSLTVPVERELRPLFAPGAAERMQAEFARLGITGKPPQHDAHVRLKRAVDDADEQVFGLVERIVGKVGV